ncbi:MAG TPA: response regulator transcription factor [Actinomycetota bacterium]|jgi:two-component system response regulator MprA|nr:response regulator transcription factor [Actinomycetota bacterium]
MLAPRARVLVVEDDRAVRDSIERALMFEGYEVASASDGVEAIAAAGHEAPDAIVLDVTMPRKDGLQVCRELRAQGDRTPVLILTARHRVPDRVAGLDAGADDYLVKPFALEELLARLRALLRRTNDGETSEVLVVGNLRLDPATRDVRRGDMSIELTKTEFSLLELLMINAGIVLSRSTIYERIWDYDFGPTSNSLEVYIGYLRRKTEAGAASRMIHTVRGVGYVLKP